MENMIEESDMHHIMKKAEVAKGRLDITWRGKSNLTLSTGDYWIITREHMDTDGNVHLFYILTEVDTPRIMDLLAKEMKYDLSAMRAYGLKQINSISINFF